MTDHEAKAEISEPVTNVFEALDLPHEAKAMDILTKFHGLALTPAVTKELLSAIVTAIREEREACAKIVDDSFGRYTSLKHEKDILQAVAAAIRGRNSDG